MMPPATILVVDDELHIRRLLCAALTRSGYAVIEAENAKAALHIAQTRQPAAAFVDLGLPDRDGLELVDILARKGGMAILVVSARDATADKIAALDLGADDFVMKPFDSDELLARLRAALRRQTPVDRESGPIAVGEIEIDVAAHVVRKGGAEIHLTPKEFALLALLAQHRGRVVTHAQLLRTIWGKGHESDLEYLRVAARNLRLKLEDIPGRPVHIRNEPGIGYRLAG
ncbi:response regulator [Novosphingobium sp. CECT 9465]|uniref:response regulator n=1 Tax=Novosphingobium sp. CECT 9465 TaxID=2829794 RepID=UPI001E3019B5|nr:response regulator transcription factor [Novosphingobium sp. CECT 9465]CAH0497207.1 KDP operon transcriptional regulatory protein KdpE [Novosphingobium sp. CECT 9465]